MKPKSIYIAGPMTGYKDFNFAAFDKARNKLNDEGWTVVSPADIDRENGFDALKGDSVELVTKEFMRKAIRADLDALQRVDAIYMLEGWEKSKGARAEYHVAQWRGLDIVFQNHKAADGLGEDFLEKAIKKPNEIKVEPYKSNLVDIAMQLHAVTHPTDPKGEAGSKKAPMWLLPPFALEQQAWAHKEGQEKYLAYNWRSTKVCASTYISAILRHWGKFLNGQNLDEHSGAHHLGHIAANCNILMDAQDRGCLIDDRP